MMKRYWIARALGLLFGASAALAQVPPTPTNLVAIAYNGSYPAVGLTWQWSASMMTGAAFRIYRSVDDTVSFHLLTMTMIKAAVDHQVMAGHTYHYYVTAVVRQDTSAVESAPSNVAGATILPGGNGPRGTISGIVTDSVTGLPLRMVGILFYRISSPLGWPAVTWTDTAGMYSAVLDTGIYLIKAQPIPVFIMTPWLVPLPWTEYMPEWYKDARSPDLATPVPVGDSSHAVANIDLERVPLPVFAAVSGTVTDTSGHPLKGASVVLLRTMRSLESEVDIPGIAAGMVTFDVTIDSLGLLRGVAWRAITDSLGHYTAHVLAGSSYIALSFKAGYLPQFYNHQSDPRDADPIFVSGDTTGIDFSLVPRSTFEASVSGTVGDSTGLPVPSRVLLLPVGFPPMPGSVRFVATDSAGAYTFSHVVPGDYLVLAIPFTGYAPAFFKAGACGVLRWKDADTVRVNGAVTGIDVCVVPIHNNGIATISGVVESSGALVVGANVYAMDASTGDIVGSSITDQSGAYLLSGIPSGTLTVGADMQGYEEAQNTMVLGPDQFSASGVNLSLSQVTTSAGASQALPRTFSLEANYPNPFNPSTRIEYSLPLESRVTITVYNLLGQQIASLVDRVEEGGNHHVIWNGRDQAGRPVASGIYFYRMRANAVGGADSFVSVRRMVLLK